MGEPSLGSRCTKPSILSILPATAVEGRMVRKSPIAGRLSKCGMWRLAKGTEFLAGGPGWAGSEDPRKRKRISRSARKSLLDREWGTPFLQECVSGKNGQSGNSRRTHRLESPECIDDGGGSRVSCEKRGSTG